LAILTKKPPLQSSSERKWWEHVHLCYKNTPAQYKDAFPWLKEVDSLALANAQLNLEKAYKNFYGLSLFVVFDLIVKHLVVDKSSTAESFSKKQLLLWRGIESILISFEFHSYWFTTSIRS